MSGNIKVKICGITNYDDASAAIDSGASLLGFVLAESKRKISPENCREILQSLEKNNLRRQIEAVGVFVNENPVKIERILRETGLDSAQIHGDEAPEDTDNYSFSWYRALRISSEEDARNLLSPMRWKTGRILVDAYSKEAYGGTGLTVPVKTALAAGRLIRTSGKEFFIAGGITPENAAEIIRSVNPDGIDLSGGVEESPGKKSHEKIRKLFQAVRDAN